MTWHLLAGRKQGFNPKVLLQLAFHWVGGLFKGTLFTHSLNTYRGICVPVPVFRTEDAPLNLGPSVLNPLVHF